MCRCLGCACCVPCVCVCGPRMCSPSGSVRCHVGAMFSRRAARVCADVKMVRCVCDVLGCGAGCSVVCVDHRLSSSLLFSLRLSPSLSVSLKDWRPEQNNESNRLPCCVPSRPPRHRRLVFPSSSLLLEPRARGRSLSHAPRRPRDRAQLHVRASSSSSSPGPISIYRGMS